jgi:hypothetical protein
VRCRVGVSPWLGVVAVCVPAGGTHLHRAWSEMVMDS